MVSTAEKSSWKRLGDAAGPVLGKPVEARRFLVIFLPVAALLTAAFALVPGEVFVSPFDLNVEQGRVEEPLKPVLHVGAPVFGEGGGKIGVVQENRGIGDEVLRR